MDIAEQAAALLDAAEDGRVSQPTEWQSHRKQLSGVRFPGGYAVAWGPGADYIVSADGDDEETHSRESAVKRVTEIFKVYLKSPECKQMLGRARRRESATADNEAQHMYRAVLKNNFGESKPLCRSRKEAAAMVEHASKLLDYVSGHIEQRTKDGWQTVEA